MEFIGGKVDLNNEEIEMKKLGYKYSLFLEFEWEDGGRFRNKYFFKTLDELKEFYKNTMNNLCEEEYLSDEEIVDLEKGELV